MSYLPRATVNFEGNVAEFYVDKTFDDGVGRYIVFNHRFGAFKTRTDLCFSVSWIRTFDNQQKGSIKLRLGWTSNRNYKLEVRATCGGREEAFFLYNKDSGRRHRYHLFKGDDPLNHIVKFKLTIEPESESQSLPSIEPQGSMMSDFKAFVEESDKVTLNCADGHVLVPKLLLEMRSAALKAMFRHDTQESRELWIDAPDFKVKTMEAFVHFLSHDKLIDGQETALELLIFADKYDIPLLRDMSKDYITKNIGQFDGNQVYELFSKVDENFVQKVFLEALQK